MILIKKGEGKSKAYADLAKISFTLMPTIGFFLAILLGKTR